MSIINSVKADKCHKKSPVSFCQFIAYQEAVFRKCIINFIQNDMGIKKIRFPETSSIGIKPISVEGTERLVRGAIEYCINNLKFREI